MQIVIPEFSRSPYGFIVLLSVAAGFIISAVRMHKSGVAKTTIRYTCLLTLICTLVFSLIMEFRITTEGIRMGFSGLGAAVGMITGIFLSGLIIRDKPESVMVSFVTTAPLMYALAKTGCLLAGCCHGKTYYGPFAVVYSGENEGSYFPVQLVDMAVFLLIHVFALILTSKMKNKVHAIYIILAVTIPVRYLLEYLKYYHDGSLISSGQITVLIAGLGAVILVTIWKIVLKTGVSQQKTLSDPRQA